MKSGVKRVALAAIPFVITSLVIANAVVTRNTRASAEVAVQKLYFQRISQEPIKLDGYKLEGRVVEALDFAEARYGKVQSFKILQTLVALGGSPFVVEVEVYRQVRTIDRINGTGYWLYSCDTTKAPPTLRRP